MVRIKNKILLMFSFGFLFSCAQTKRLDNGTKVLTKKFKNIDKFDKSIFEKIDTDYFYQKVDYYMANENFQKIEISDTTLQNGSANLIPKSNFLALGRLFKIFPSAFSSFKNLSTTLAGVYHFAHSYGNFNGSYFSRYNYTLPWVNDWKRRANSN